MRSPFWLLLLATACAGASPPSSALPSLATAPPAPLAEVAPTAASPRVLVTIVVDQLAAWIAEERWPDLPQDGGFARLRREGTWMKQMRYAHAVTDTAPGHSSLYTGLTPRESGVFANEVPDTKGGRRSILSDPSAHLVTEEGERPAPAASLARLHGDTLADVFLRSDPGAVVLSFSLKDRGALFGSGRSPRAALWFSPKDNRIVTSTAIAPAIPPWALAVASRAALVRVESKTWNLLDAPWIAAHAKTPDDQPGEGDLTGFGHVFPHALANAKEPGGALRTSPFGDELLFALALAGIDGEKVAGHDALVALSLSSNDYVGHVFGPDSWEAWDELARLDASLGRFLAGLDARFGREGYSVLLTADHGVATMPEAALVPGVRGWCDASQKSTDAWERPCGRVVRLRGDALLSELRQVTRAALGPGEWVADVINPYVYLTPAARALDGARRERLDETVNAALRSHPEIRLVSPTRARPEECPPERDESVAALVCRSIPEGAGDYYVVPARGSFFDPEVVAGKGSSHGSPYLFDRAVPLLARAPGRIVAGEVVEAPASFETFSRAAGALLGVDGPGHPERGAEIVKAR